MTLIPETRFERAVEKTLASEGLLSDHPRDSGGLTKYGIAQRHHPEVNVLTLTLEQAKAIYKAKYWDMLQCDRLRSARIAEELFDTAVNCGNGRAVLFMQKAYNLLRRRAIDEELKEDGAIGPKTLRCVNTFSGLYENALYRAMNYFQAAHYERIGSPDFMRGWFGRRLD